MTPSLLNYAQVNIIQSEDFLTTLASLAPSGLILLITSKGFSKRGVVKQVTDVLGKPRVIVFDDVTPNPELSDLKSWFNKVNSGAIKHVVALGGGSVIDTAKVMAFMLANLDSELESSLQQPARVRANSIPMLAIPTTSGTGSEVTPFATVWDRSTQKKFSLVNVAPKIAILDAKLTLSLQRDETLYPALDALSHALESIWNKNRTDQTHQYAIQAIEGICAALPIALKQPQNLQARKTLQQAATLSGMAISHTKTAIAHAISYPLTLKYNMPHGLACSFTLLAILGELGADKLNLSAAMVDTIVDLLSGLAIEKEIQHFVDWQTLIDQFEPKLDPSRAGNFLIPIDSAWLTDIILKSQHPKALGEVNET